MSLLELILLAELLFLFSGYCLYIAGRMVIKFSPNDTIHQFAIVFWRTMRNRPPPLKEVVPDADDEGGEAGDEEDLLAGLTSDDDERPARSKGAGAPAAATGVRMATINVKVIPHASRDQVCGFLGNALKVQVTATAEAGQANKAVIDLLSTTLGLKSHQIQLLRGHYQEMKVLQISGMRQDELNSRLSSFQ